MACKRIAPAHWRIVPDKQNELHGLVAISGMIYLRKLLKLFINSL